jgi:hypothetical protein
MEYAVNEGMDWRAATQEWLEKELQCVVFNPNRESVRFFSKHYPSCNFRSLKHTDLSQYQTIVSKLVDLDCKEIADRSDFVVCYWDESAMKGAGTKGELTMAKYFGKPVYLVTSIHHYDIPGWVLGCTTEILPSFEALKAFLLKQGS